MTVAICLACCAKVRTPLNSPIVGAKSNFPPGIASASSTISRSALRNRPSNVCPRLGESAANIAQDKASPNEVQLIRIIFIFSIPISFQLSCILCRAPQGTSDVVLNPSRGLAAGDVEHIAIGGANLMFRTSLRKKETSNIFAYGRHDPDTPAPNAVHTAEHAMDTN